MQFTAVPPSGASGAYFMLSRDCDSIDPPTPALRSCPGSCVGSPALKNVKSDEQCTAAAPLSPTNHIVTRREATAQTGQIANGPAPSTAIEMCTDVEYTETVESCTLYT